MRTFAQQKNQEHVVPGPARSNVAPPRMKDRADLILHMQSAIGNQAVYRMLRPIGGELEAGSTNTAAGAIQTKLAINTPGDKYEQEADRISDQVMGMPCPQLQRACPCGEGQDQASDMGRIEAPPIVHEVLAAPGQPLDTATREFMESRFGHDFSRVRVHTDQLAARSADAVGAEAYTVGPNVVFGSGGDAPASRNGYGLLAHELTHVVQQGAAPRVAGSMSDPDLTVGKGLDAQASITPASPGIQRRNGGARPPARRPLLPSRGREGQREGQRLPRSSTRREAARRERFERRERERIEAARRRFDEMVKRNQRWLENWAKEGSEPKTPAERAFRVLVKMLEAWDELTTSWNKTHSALEEISQRRLDLSEAARSNPQLASSMADFDRDLLTAWQKMNHFDVMMLRRMTEWQERMDKWEQWRDRVYPTVTNVINLSIDLAALLIDAHKIAVELQKELTQLDWDIGFKLLGPAGLRPRWQVPMGPRQTSMSEAD